MADYTYPATLPEPEIDGLEEQPPNLVVRTSMDAGPAKVRRRFTDNVRPLKIRFRGTAAQCQTFDDFYTTTTAGGSLRFDMEHPRTGETEEFRFVSQPKYKMLGPDAWEVSMELEQMP